MLRTLVIALALALAAPAAAEPTRTAKEQDIVELLEMTGTKDLGRQVMAQIQIQMEQMLPSVPGEFWDEFDKRVDVGKLLDLIVPIYDRHFSHDEIKGLIAFYKTPLGTKAISVMPAVTQEAMAAGQKWGAELAQEVILEFERQEQERERKALEASEPAK
jgi:hypothetical protein